MEGANAELRQEMLKHKKFLLALYKGSPRKNKTLMKHASAGQLQTLLKVLARIGLGEIPITKESADKLRLSKRQPKLSTLVKNEECLLTMNNETLLKKLVQFSSLFPHLLKPLFEKLHLSKK